MILLVSHGDTLSILQVKCTLLRAEGWAARTCIVIASLHGCLRRSP